MTAAALSGPLPAAGRVQFLGKEGAYWRLRIKGAALLVVTLGIYRFWLSTDVRRYLWSNTEIAGDTLEYNGLATELLVGFLFAIAILVPLYMGLAIAALEIESVAVRPVAIGLLILALLGEYALYRARRYRLTRTVFRGVRFDQHGSGSLIPGSRRAWSASRCATPAMAICRAGSKAPACSSFCAGCRCGSPSSRPSSSPLSPCCDSSIGMHWAARSPKATTRP